MQTSRRLLVLNLTPVTRSFIRNVTATNAVKEEEVGGKPWKEIPGLPSLPLIGQMLYFLPGSQYSDMTTFSEKMYEKFGPIVRIAGMLGRKPLVLLFDPDACATILRAENVMPIRPGFQSIEYYRKYHNKPKEQATQITGLITDHNENWRTFRTKVNPVLMQPKTIKMYHPLVEQVADDMIKRMRSIRNDKNMLEGDFDMEMNLWSLESIGVVALGGRLNCLNSNLPENSPERRLIHCVHEIFRISNELDFQISLWRYFSTKAFKNAMKVYEEQENLAKYFIGKAKQELLGNKKPENEKGILEKLLDIDEKVAVIMASDMLFAGVDTAATSVTGILHLLATNQDKQDILREKLSTGDKDSQRYLKACVKEGMRLLPVVSGNLRETTKEYNILGYKIPKGMNIVFSHQHLCKMENQFPRAKEYIPERWIEESPLHYKSAHPFAFMPFGFGIRMCIGRRIAELEIETFVAKVIQNFKVEWFGPPPKFTAQSLIYFSPPFNFTFKDVK